MLRVVVDRGGVWTHELRAAVHVPYFFLQLALWVERGDVPKFDYAYQEMLTCKNPDAKHVRILWCMESDKRVQVWRKLGRFRRVTELEIGGEHGSIEDDCGGCDCDVGKKELFMLLPEGKGALAGLHKLLLWRCANMDDGFLRALASAGCGKNLTSLTLRSGCLLCSWLSFACESEG